MGSAGLVEEDGAKTFRRVEGFDTSDIEFVGSYGQPNAGAVVAQNPDLIVGYELDEALLDFADPMGRTDRAEEFRARYARRVDSLLDGPGDRRDGLSVSVISSGDTSGQFYRADVGWALGTVMGDLNLPRPVTSAVKGTSSRSAWRTSPNTTPT